MPAGLPKASEIWDGTVSFFSIDTDLIQGAGYRFGEGILGLLPKVSPVTMKLLITEVVAREIVAHLLKPVVAAQGNFHSATAALSRAGDIPMTEINELFAKLDIESSAAATFRKRIETYVQHIRGSILPIDGEHLAARMFDLYFDVKPPFEENKEKKAEFPDAASLLLLEQYANDEDTFGIIAAKDGGAKKFAERSDRLYRVASLDELSELFKATGARAEAITAHLRKSVEDPESDLHKTLNDALVDHVADAEWDIEDAVCGIVPRVETEFSSAELSGFKLDTGSAKVWNDTTNRTVWMVEVAARITVEVEANVTFYVWDSFDREEHTLTSDTVVRQFETQVSAFVTCTGALDDTDSSTWDFEVDIAKGDYLIQLGEVNPDMG